MSWTGEPPGGWNPTRLIPSKHWKIQRIVGRSVGLLSWFGTVCPRAAALLEGGMATALSTCQTASLRGHQIADLHFDVLIRRTRPARLLILHVHGLLRAAYRRHAPLSAGRSP